MSAKPHDASVAAWLFFASDMLGSLYDAADKLGIAEADEGFPTPADFTNLEIALTALCDLILSGDCVGDAKALVSRVTREASNE